MSIRRPLALALSAAALAAVFAAPAHAAGTGGIILNATDSKSSLAGQTFTAYQIGTYANTVEKDGVVSSYELKGSTESNTWVRNVVDAYNAKSDKDVATPAGQDAVAALTKADATQLRQLANQMAAAQDKPQAAATQPGSGQTVTLAVPDGLYLVTGDNMVPMIVSTKIDGKDFTGMTLGTATVKSKAVELSKKLVVNGQEADSGSLTVGSTATWRIKVTLPNTGSGTAVSLKVIDAPSGEKFTGNLDDITATVDDADVTGQIDKVAGGGVLKANANVPGDVDRTVPADGFGVSLDRLAQSKPGRTVTITAKTVITSPAAANHPQAAMTYTAIYDGTTPPVISKIDPPTDGKCPADAGAGVACVSVPVTTYGFDLNKTSMGDETRKVSGAGFVIKDENSGKYLKWGADGWTLVDAASPDAAKAAGCELLTGDADHDGTLADAERTADTAGRITYKGLGAGTYTVTETTVPAGFSSMSKPSFTAAIAQNGAITFTGVNLPNLTVQDGRNVTVKNMTKLAQLPATGGVWTVGSFMAGAAILAALSVGSVTLARRKHAEGTAPIQVA